MGIRYVCSDCGYLLYEYKRENGKVIAHPKDLSGSRGLLTPSEIIAFYNGRCPRCGRKLRLPSLDSIVIKPLR